MVDTLSRFLGSKRFLELRFLELMVVYNHKRYLWKLGRFADGFFHESHGIDFALFLKPFFYAIGHWEPGDKEWKSRFNPE